mmetsp:Transcript_2794/g.4517  ORF Transcript_2794/g.4517 Transcript_2794/m.4517 type:complete len:110 (+) Transcript_2794:103-432(+)
MKVPKYLDRGCSHKVVTDGSFRSNVDFSHGTTSLIETLQATSTGTAHASSTGAVLQYHMLLSPPPLKRRWVILTVYIVCFGSLFLRELIRMTSRDLRTKDIFGMVLTRR